ncbi:MAG: iron ABC transporter permease [Alphaproteobacteria bacterium]|nr:iron ABC transporter permease [Alphaproteobacteria bacterium]
MIAFFTRHPFALHALLAIILLVAAFGALAVGQVPLSLAQVWQGLRGLGDGLERVIVWDIRLPRVILAILGGAVLGMAGAAMQGFLRNPLADPGLLGVTNGAALGAVIAIYGGFAATSTHSLPIFAMIGALLAVALACVLAGLRSSPYSLILAGIAISSLFGAGVALALNLAPNPFAAMEVVFWLMGSLEGRSGAEIILVLPFLLLGVGLMLSCGRALNALSLGNQTASSLGISLPSVQGRLIAGIALSVGAITSVAGSIGFVGLVVPHLLRPLVGSQPSRLLSVSALGGAVLVLLADIAVRAIPTSGMELRLGVVTALVGAPFFLWLLFHERKREGL